MFGSLIGSLIGGVGSLLGMSSAKKEAKKNREMQERAMTESIQMRVADAKKAGIHPLYAIGAPSMSPAPITSGAPEMMANLGQDIGRAASVALSPEGKANAYTKSLQALQLERGALENTLLRSQIAKMNQAGTPPGAPGGGELIPGQGDSRQLHALGLTWNPKKSESQAEAFENEYGEAADVIGAVRMGRDIAPSAEAMILNSIRAGFTVRPGSIADRVLKWYARQPDKRGRTDFQGKYFPR